MLTGLALAAEPFLVANQQLVHVDGPLVAFTTLGVLAALVRFTAGGGIGTLAAGGRRDRAGAPLEDAGAVPGGVRAAGGGGDGGSGVSWELAGGATRNEAAGTAALPAIRRALIDLVVWGAVALATFVALWPALWVLGPAEVLDRVVAFTRETGGQPDEVGSFFFGQVGADPGPFYYPVSTLFRLSPYATLGLLLAAVLVWRAPRRGPGAGRLAAGLRGRLRPDDDARRQEVRPLPAARRTGPGRAGEPGLVAAARARPPARCVRMGLGVGLVVRRASCRCS